MSHGGYEKHRARMGERMRAASRSGRDIGHLPPVRNPERKMACAASLALDLRTYYPGTFCWPFSEDHLRFIGHIEYALLEGGKRLEEAYRKFGKTVILERACLWALKYGYRRCVLLFGSDRPASERNMRSVKNELETNEMLFEDFPEVCAPIRALGRITQRSGGQLYLGRPTFLQWKADHIQFPMIPGSACAGAVFGSFSMGGTFLGVKYHLPDGTVVIPEIALIDDPQTPESASSPVQTERRVDTIRSGIGRAGGHAKEMSILIAATPYAAGDLTARFASRDESPDWQVDYIPMLPKRAESHESFWLGPYAEIRRRFDPANPSDRLRARHEATAHYLAHRAEADAGAVVSWEACHTADEVSGIQHAYNILIDEGWQVFESQCQCRPVDVTIQEEEPLTPAMVMKRCNGLRRGEVRSEWHTLTCHVDIGDKYLSYVVVGWDDSFGGGVVEYGTWPDQKRAYFTKSDARRTLGQLAPGAEKEGAIQAGLETLLADLRDRKYKRHDGAEMQIGVGGVDFGYKRDVAFRAIRRAGRPWIPMLGRGIGARGRPMSEWTRKPGERFDRAFHWVQTLAAHPGEPRPLMVDVNWFKTFVQGKFKIARGDKGAIELWGKDGEEHRLFADHLAASERAVCMTREDTGRTVWEWEAAMGRPDNEYFDNLVGCAALASFAGVRMPIEAAPKAEEGKAGRSAYSPLKVGGI